MTKTFDEGLPDARTTNTASLPRIISERAHKDGSRPFIIEAGGDTWTYGEIDALSSAWAAGLNSIGVVRGHNVVTMLPNGAATVAVWNGIAKRAAVEVPINVAFKGRMLADIISRANARVGIVEARYLHTFLDALNPECAVRTVVVVGEYSRNVSVPEGLELLAAGAVTESPNCVLDEVLNRWDAACILFTSGTTGPSKGAIMPWRLMTEIWSGLAPERTMTADDRFYLPLPVFHMAAKCLVVLMAIRGGSVVLKNGFALKDFWSDIAEHDCSVTLLLGTMPELLLGNGQPQSRDHRLSRVLCVPSSHLLAEMRSRWGVDTFTWYGLTEGGVPVAQSNWNADVPGSCGRVNPEYECRIVDENDEEVPDGTVGEFVLRGRKPWSTFSGYWGMPAQTAEVLKNQWFHTGDAMMRDPEGNLFFVDRIKDSIRRKGENISSAEVEREVLDYPAVKECAAVPVRTSVGEDEIKVCVVLRAGETFDEHALLRFLVARMPHFMVPRYVEVIDELPKTVTAKVQKVKLREAGVSNRTWDRVAAGVRLRDLANQQ